jgi:hypothetical protein
MPVFSYSLAAALIENLFITNPLIGLLRVGGPTDYFNLNHQMLPNVAEEPVKFSLRGKVFCDALVTPWQEDATLKPGATPPITRRQHNRHNDQPITLSIIKKAIDLDLLAVRRIEKLLADEDESDV